MAPLAKDYPIILLVGAPGSGKSTQSEKIAKTYNLTHLSTGALLRDEMRSGSDIGKVVKELMDAEKLVEPDIILQLIKNAVEKAIASGETRGFLIDGYRDIAHDVERAKFEQEVGECLKVLFLDAPDSTLIARLQQRGKTSDRSDDKRLSVTKRIYAFQKGNKSLIEHYEGVRKLVTIDANREIDEVFADARKVLDPMLNKSSLFAAT